jgi:hypothetical protein
MVTRGTHFVIAGLDPAIHPLRKKFLRKPQLERVSRKLMLVPARQIGHMSRFGAAAQGLRRGRRRE